MEPRGATLAAGLGLPPSFHRRVNALADENLAAPSRVAEPCGEVSHRADRAVVESPFEANLPQGRVAERDPDAEFELEAVLPPLDCELPDTLPHPDGHLHGARGGVCTGH